MRQFPDFKRWASSQEIRHQESQELSEKSQNTIQTKNQFYRFAICYSPPSGGLHVLFVSLVPEFPPGPHFPVARHMRNCNCPLCWLGPSPVSISAFFCRLLFHDACPHDGFFHWDDGKNTKMLYGVHMQRTHSEVIHSWTSPLIAFVGSSRTVGMTRVAALTCPMWRRTLWASILLPHPKNSGRVPAAHERRDEGGE